VTAPVFRFTRLIMPRFVRDRHIGVLAFLLVASVWLALKLLKFRLAPEATS